MKRILIIAAIAATSLMAFTQTRMPVVERDMSQEEYTDYNNGFWISSELNGGCSLRLNEHNTGFTGLNVTGGYRFNEFLKVGIGFGGRYYFNNDHFRKTSIDWAFPVYANVRGDLAPQYYRTVVPYYSVNIGAAVRDGFMFQPSVGLRIGEHRSNFILSLSYLGQQMTLKDSKANLISFLVLGLGYEF